MEHLVEILVPIACGCVLPIVIVWLAIRSEMNKTNQRTQIVLAAIEKNPDMDLEDLMAKISPKKKLLALSASSATCRTSCACVFV